MAVRSWDGIPLFPDIHDAINIIDNIMSRSVALS